MERHKEVNVEVTDYQGFNNNNHLVNFINYLFRTDRNQKHTNDNTDFCTLSIRIDDEITTIPFTSVEERLEMRNMCLKLSTGVKLDDLVNGISYLEILGEDGKDITHDLSYDEIMEVVNAVVVEKEKEGYCLFHVTHLDQGQWHIHTMLVEMNLL